jgi:hypothetical protein
MGDCEMHKIGNKWILSAINRPRYPHIHTMKVVLLILSFALLVYSRGHGGRFDKSYSESVQKNPCACHIICQNEDRTSVGSTECSATCGAANEIAVCKCSGNSKMIKAKCRCITSKHKKKTCVDQSTGCSASASLGTNDPERNQSGVNACCTATVDFKSKSITTSANLGSCLN